MIKKTITTFLVVGLLTTGIANAQTVDTQTQINTLLEQTIQLLTQEVAQLEVQLAQTQAELATIINVTSTPVVSTTTQDININDNGGGGGGIVTQSSMPSVAFTTDEDVSTSTDVTTSTIVSDASTISTSTDQSSTPTLGTDATLASISVNLGTVEPTFDPDTYSYGVQENINTIYPNGEASGTVINPTITAQTNDPNATETITQATTFPGVATIVVIAQDGIEQETYTINYSLVN